MNGIVLSTPSYTDALAASVATTAAAHAARQNILVQAGTAMLAQANQLPQTTLRLLQ